MTGPAPILTYQQILADVTYTNAAPEPTQGDRTLTFQVLDGAFASNILAGTISIGLINDNDLILTCGSQPRVFVEGFTLGTYITPGLLLSDLDIDHTITSARVILHVPQYGDKLNINESISTELSVTNNSTAIEISGISTATEYQVSKTL